MMGAACAAVEGSEMILSSGLKEYLLAVMAVETREEYCFKRLR